MNSEGVGMGREGERLQKLSLRWLNNGGGWRIVWGKVEVTGEG